MPSVLLWACLAENLFLFAAQKNLRIFLSCFFTGRGRGSQRMLHALERRSHSADHGPSFASLYSPFCRYATSSPDRGKSLLAGGGQLSCNSRTGQIKNPPSECSGSYHGRHSYRMGPATTTTAASGRCREELLGQRPARRTCRPRHDAAAGCRNPIAEAIPNCL